MAPSLFPKTKPSFCQNLKYICQKYRVKMFWSKSKQPKAQRSQWWVSFTRVENYRTNNQFCCLGRYRAWAYLATRYWWRALRAGAYQINQQTIIVFLFAVVVVINLDDGVCRSLLIVIAVSGTMFKPLSLATWTFVWQLDPLFGSSNLCLAAWTWSRDKGERFLWWSGSSQSLRYKDFEQSWLSDIFNKYLYSIRSRK